ncbi:MAG: hypothetical protein FK733_06135 [Asgard group archaeon]|nr:hypothetical protein [Asgard group archaeon]
MIEENDKNKNDKVKSLSEKEIAYTLLLNLQKLGYTAVTELVLNDLKFDIPKLVGKNISKVRIDLAAHKNEKITFIEVENGLWITHPQIYRKLAHILFLAYPAEYNSLTDEEQILFAKSKGIGIITVTANGSIKTTLKPIEHEIPIHLAKSIISLIDKKWKKDN